MDLCIQKPTHATNMTLDNTDNILHNTIDNIFSIGILVNDISENIQFFTITEEEFATSKCWFHI